MPTVEIYYSSSVRLTTEQKKALIKAVTDAGAYGFGLVGRPGIIVWIHETPPENVGMGGEPLKEGEKSVFMLTHGPVMIAEHKRELVKALNEAACPILGVKAVRVNMTQWFDENVGSGKELFSDPAKYQQKPPTTIKR